MKARRSDPKVESSLILSSLLTQPGLSVFFLGFFTNTGSAATSVVTEEVSKSIYSLLRLLSSLLTIFRIFNGSLQQVLHLLLAKYAFLQPGCTEVLQILQIKIT